MRGLGRMAESPELRAEWVDLRVLTASCATLTQGEVRGLQTALDNALNRANKPDGTRLGMYSALQPVRGLRLSVVRDGAWSWILSCLHGSALRTGVALPGSRVAREARGRTCPVLFRCPKGAQRFQG